MDTKDYLDYVNHRYREPMFLGKAPDWKCPYCRLGTLYLKDTNFRNEETDESKKDRKNPEWEPEWIRYTFVAFLKCTKCNDKTAVIGEGGVGSSIDQETGAWLAEEEFMPKFFCPTLPIFELPPEAPVSVKKHIDESFALAWSDFSAAGNKLRIAVERLIDEISPDSKGRLHDRIEKLGEPYSEISKLLMAIKWLGNDGSHEAKLKEYDVAFAYEVFKAILTELYGPRKNIEKLAQLVNSAKGTIAG